MKYFITGATGFLGKHLIPEIKNYTTLKGDLNDKLDLTGIDTVIHLAAIIKSKHKASFYKVNVLGTKNLVDACLKAGVKNILFVSSYSAYNQSAYGQSKLAAEEIIKKSGLNFAILRPTIIYGEGDHGLFKLKKLIKKYPIIPVFGNGKYKLYPIDVKKIIKTIVSILEKNAFDNQTYDLIGKPITYNEIIDQFCRELKKKRIKIHLPLCLVKLLIGIYEKIAPNPFITVEQINNLTHNYAHKKNHSFNR